MSWRGNVFLIVVTSSFTYWLMVAVGFEPTPGLFVSTLCGSTAGVLLVPLR